MKRILVAIAACVFFACGLSAQTTHTAYRFFAAPSAPATCAPGDVYYNTTTNTPSYCSATNTWTAFGSGGGGGGITSITFSGPLTGGTITTTGTVGCPTCVTSAAALTNNAVVIGGGLQASSTIGADTTTTHALFATAGAPAFRAIAAGDIPVAIPIANVGSAGLSGTSPIAIAATGAISCATCAIGPGVSTANHLAKFSGTDGVTLADGGAIPAGTVTSVGLNINGGASSGIFAASGSPVATSGTLNYNLTLTSGGIPYASSTSVLSTSGLLTQFGVLFGGGAGGAPTSSAQGGSNFPLIGQGAANPVFSTIAYPTSLTSGGFLYASSTTAFAGSALLATGTVPKSGGAGSAPVASSAVDNGTTYAISEPVTGTSFAAGTSPPTCTAGTSGVICLTEGTAPTAASTVYDIYADSTLHAAMIHENGGSPAMLVASLPGSIQQTGKTAAITTATLCAASAGACNQAGEYHVHLAMEQAGTACSANTTNGVAFQLTWTDKNAVTHSAVTIPLDTSASLIALSGTMAWPATGVTAYASADFNLFTNGTIIQYATTYANCTTGGAAAYDIAIAVTRVQ